MPFKSKAQQKFMFAAEDRGEVPEGTAERWAKHTPNIKKLPEKVKDKEDGHKKEAALRALSHAVVLRKKATFFDSSKQALDTAETWTKEKLPIAGKAVGENPFMSTVAGTGIGAGLGALMMGRKRRLLGALLGGLGGGALGYGLSAYLKSRMAPTTSDLMAVSETKPSAVHPLIQAESDVRRAPVKQAAPAGPVNFEPTTGPMPQQKSANPERVGYDPRTGLPYN